MKPLAKKAIIWYNGTESPTHAVDEKGYIL